MNSREEKERVLRSRPQGGLESPFLGEELFAKESEAEWEAHLALLEAESPFQRAFEPSQTNLTTPAELAEELVGEGDETREKSLPDYPVELKQEEQFFEDETPLSEEELLPLEEEKDVFKSGDDEAIVAAETLYAEEEAPESELEEEAIGPVPTPNDFLQYLEELVDEEVFDEEAQSAQADWQAYPTIHAHFAGKSAEERFAKYLEIRPLYQQAAGINNPARWIAENIIRVAFFGHRTPCHRDLRAPLAAAEDTLRTQAFTPAIDSFWGYVPRAMRTRNRLSNHALGRAIDINSKTNPHIYNKEDILVIREATGVDLGQQQMHDAMRRANQLFRQTFNQQWVDRKTGEVLEAIRKRREALDTYARAGFLNLEQPLIDALLNAGFTWGGDWQSEKDFMHFELPPARRIAPTVPSAAVRRPSGAAKPAVEMVRFAQRVLNAAEGERLAVDGDLGRLTRGAMERFRQKYNLGAGSVLDDPTEIGLAQRALEELAQQSLFEKGKWDAATIQALSEFKSKRGLGSEATLDAATRAALADALARPAIAPGGPVPVVTPLPAGGFLKDVPQLQTLALAPISPIAVDRGWPTSRRALADTYNRLGGVMGALATGLAIELAAVLAVWRVESGGRTHTPGRAIIRFENHLLFRLWGQNNRVSYNQHFRHGGHDAQPGKAWENHQYRDSADQPFKPVHTGKQEDEYAALDLGIRLAGDTVALQCISIGGPQILIRGYRLLGYKTPKEIYDAFQASERWHVLGFFDFCRTKRAPRAGQLINYLRERNWDQFAYYYNGPGQVSTYGGRIGNAYQEARPLPITSARELEFA